MYRFLLIFTVIPSLLFFFLCIILLSPPQVHAASGNVQDVFTQSLPDLIQQDKDKRKKCAEKNAPCIDGIEQQKFIYQNAAPYALLSGLICVDKEICGDKPTVMSNLIMIAQSMYANPPASGYAYTRDLLANAGLASPAYAQGIGFAGLAPFLPLWKATRDISYAILILVMIIIGFMIIFRMQLDPKTVISVQAALPKIVLALILITLSYPIVGFLIDLMYVVMGILISILTNAMPATNGPLGSYPAHTIAGWNSSDLQTQFLTGDIGDLFKAIFSGGLRSIEDFATGFYGLEGLSAGIGGLSAIIGSFSVLSSAIIGLIAPVVIFALILVLGLIFTWVRLLIILLNSYIQLLIAVILGPLLLLNEAIPGRSGFKEWIMNIIANLSVFPTTALVLLFATFLTSYGGTSGNWAPPFTGFAAKGFFNAFLGMCVIFMAPHLVSSVKKALSPQPTLPISAGTALSPLTGGFQTVMSSASSFYALQQLTSSGPLKSIMDRFKSPGGS